MADDSNIEARRDHLKTVLVAVGKGDRNAFESAYRLTSAKLFGICLRILGDRGEAEDVLQQVYVSVWQRAATFDPSRASPITWLATLARNRAIDRLRSLKRKGGDARIEEAADVADSNPDAFERLATAQGSTRLAGCVGELEPRTAEAIRSAFFGGLTYRELAERGGVPLGTIKSWIRRGLSKLKDCLEQ